MVRHFISKCCYSVKKNNESLFDYIFQALTKYNEPQTPTPCSALVFFLKYVFVLIKFIQ